MVRAMSTWYLTHSSTFDFQNLLYAPLKQSPLWQKHHIILPHDTIDEQINNSKAWISESNFILAEVSFPSTGQGIEIGWAHALHKPIICFHQKGTTPSHSLQFVSDKIFPYSSPGNLINQLEHI